jgi:hypothetical protein
VIHHYGFVGVTIRAFMPWTVVIFGAHYLARFFERIPPLGDGTAFGDILSDRQGHMVHGVVNVAIAFKPCVAEEETGG